MPLRRRRTNRSRLQRLVVLAVVAGAAAAWRGRKLRENQQRFGLP